MQLSFSEECEASYSQAEAGVIRGYQWITRSANYQTEEQIRQLKEKLSDADE